MVVSSRCEPRKSINSIACRPLTVQRTPSEIYDSRGAVGSVWTSRWSTNKKQASISTSGCSLDGNIPATWYDISLNCLTDFELSNVRYLKFEHQRCQRWWNEYWWFCRCSWHSHRLGLKIIHIEQFSPVFFGNKLTSSISNKLLNSETVRLSLLS